MLETVSGDCDTAIGGLAEINNSNLTLKAQLFSDEGDESFDYKFTGSDIVLILVKQLENDYWFSGKKFKEDEYFNNKTVDCSEDLMAKLFL